MRGIHIDKLNTPESIIFTAGERIRLTHSILTSSVEDKGAALSLQDFVTIYPVHDRDFNKVSILLLIIRNG